MTTRIPDEAGSYYWSAWKRVVKVDKAVPFNWRRPTKAGRKTLCVLPFPGFPFAVAITQSIAGTFKKVEQHDVTTSGAN